MNLDEIIAALQDERQRIDDALRILTGHASTQSDNPVSALKTKKKRNMSPEGRMRIAEAVKRRWAAQKKAKKGA
jgi:hypothetical protein